MPSGRAYPSAGQSCERLRRAAGALAAEGDVALVARDKTVLEAAREAVSAAPRRRVVAVNCDTVLRALRLLRDEGLLEFRRGHGITVAATPQRGAVLTQARELVRLARQHATAAMSSSRASKACRSPHWPSPGADQVRPIGAMGR
jgi:DNA-binding transcriptional MocR family regulator